MILIPGKKVNGIIIILVQKHGVRIPQYCGSNWTTQSGRIINFTNVENGFDHIEQFILNTVDEYDSNLFHHWDWDDDHTRWQIRNTGHGLSVVT